MPRLFLLLVLCWCTDAAWAQRGASAGAASAGAGGEATFSAPISTGEAIGAGAATEPRDEAAATSRRSSAEDAPIYYVVRERPRVFSKPDSSVALGRLDFREDVRVIEQDAGWSRVLTDETIGWVATAALSNTWILVDKGSRTLHVYQGTELVRSLPADVSQNPEEDKVRRASLGESGHYRIPEGEFYVCQKNNNSQYYRALMLSYPAPEDAERGLEAGLISQGEYDAIVRAALRFQSPPMGTRLGGAIAIHGQGSGKRRAWTRGCVALRDVHIDAIWDLVDIGTPVLIR